MATPNVISGQAIGSTITVQDSAELALLSIQGITVGTSVYNVSVGSSFILTISNAALVPDQVVSVDDVVGLRWIKQAATIVASTYSTVLYVSPTGDDTKDGLTWPTAKKTVNAAVDIGGSAIINVANGVSFGPNVDDGLWIMGPLDPGRHDYTTGCVFTNGSAVVTRAAGGFTGVVNSGDWIWKLGPVNNTHHTVLTVDSDTHLTLTAPVTDGDFTGYAVKVPANWRLGGGTVLFQSAGGTEGVLTTQPMASISGGATRDQSKPAIWLSHVQGGYTFDGIQVDNAAIPLRIGVDSTGGRNAQVANVFFRNCQLAATGAVGAFDTVGPTVDIGYILWVYFDNVFFGGVGSLVPHTNDNRALVLIKPTSLGTGLVYFNRCRGSGGGGIKQYTNGLGYACDVTHLTVEGDGSASAPVYWCPDASAFGYVRLVDLVSADTTPDPGVVYIQGNPPSDCFVVTDTSGPVVGSATIINTGYPPVWQTETNSPLSRNQVGTWQGNLLGLHNSARRLVAPTSARFQNLCSYNVAGLTPGTHITLASATSLDGLSNAGRISTGTAGSQSQDLYSASFTPVAGDIVFVGAWVRRQTITGNPANPLIFNLPAGSTFTSGNQYLALFMPLLGDGEWEYLYISGTIQTAGAPGNAVFSALVDPGNTIDVCYPFLYHFAANAMSANELAEFIIHHHTPPDYMAPGFSGTMPNQKFVAHGGLGTAARYTVGAGSGQITIGAAAAQAIEVFDESGNSLGVIQPNTFTVNP